MNENQSNIWASQPIDDRKSAQEELCFSETLN